MKVNDFVQIIGLPFSVTWCDNHEINSIGQIVQRGFNDEYWVRINNQIIPYDVKSLKTISYEEFLTAKIIQS